jgi:hypothetical protein
VVDLLLPQQPQLQLLPPLLLQVLQGLHLRMWGSVEERQDMPAPDPPQAADQNWQLIAVGLMAVVVVVVVVVVLVLVVVVLLLTPAVLLMPLLQLQCVTHVSGWRVPAPLPYPV